MYDARETHHMWMDVTDVYLLIVVAILAWLTIGSAVKWARKHWR